ncbi:hypothetical protein SAMN04487766_12018 [Actinomyces ruminicola]|uniref:Uncharacterized protein n=1 Tax=Actinomyces ruminicola TaxID=332524 RepID=A0A1G9ZXD6_9ACTO|nr:hypothetical protein SAMN04487766_12018 [Actinomyces ruminicola]
MRPSQRRGQQAARPNTPTIRRSMSLLMRPSQRRGQQAARPNTPTTRTPASLLARRPRRKGQQGRRPNTPNRWPSPGGRWPFVGYRRERGALGRCVVGWGWLVEYALFVPEPSTLAGDWGARGRSRRALVVLGRGFLRAGVPAAVRPYFLIGAWTGRAKPLPAGTVFVAPRIRPGDAKHHPGLTLPPLSTPTFPHHTNQDPDLKHHVHAENSCRPKHVVVGLAGGVSSARVGRLARTRVRRRGRASAAGDALPTSVLAGNSASSRAPQRPRLARAVSAAPSRTSPGWTVIPSSGDEPGLPRPGRLRPPRSPLGNSCRIRLRPDRGGTARLPAPTAGATAPLVRGGRTRTRGCPRCTTLVATSGRDGPRAPT